MSSWIRRAVGVVSLLFGLGAALTLRRNTNSPSDWTVAILFIGWVSASGLAKMLMCRDRFLMPVTGGALLFWYAMMGYVFSRYHLVIRFDLIDLWFFLWPLVDLADLIIPRSFWQKTE